MTYEHSIQRMMPSVSKIPSPIQNATQDNRTYFAGLKKPDTSRLLLQGNQKENNITDNIIDFIQDNPLWALGGAVLSGLYLFSGKKKTTPIIPKNNSKIYTDAITATMGGIATLIASAGVIKRLSQESPETVSLRHELKKLQTAKRKYTPEKGAKKNGTPLDYNMSSDICDIDMSTFFQN
jgi:hypothetical protein